MYNNLLHTPEGFRDIYGAEFKKRSIVNAKLLDTIRDFHYMSIETPCVEYFDVFSSDIGTTPSNELYKFFDKEGNTLVLRPDFTPSIARVAATYFSDYNTPLRFMYSGLTYTNSSDLQGRLKEVMQVGCELIGDDSIDADLEIISIISECAKALNIDDFQICIGNADYFKGLCREFVLDRTTELNLRDMVSNKNYYGAKAILDNYDISDECKNSILGISELFGGVDCLDKAIENAGNEQSVNAVERLIKLYSMLDKKKLSKYVSFDLSMLSKYNYYTGVVFKGYTYGSGDAIFKGGRYDNLLKEFGKASPAIGFCATVDQLVDIISRSSTAKKLFEGI